jgi:serine/threonine protein kinase
MAWLGSRVAPGLGRARRCGFVREREVKRARVAFYTVFDWHAGRTLEQMMSEGRRFEVGEIVDAALAVARALGRLHRHGVIHRDLKPATCTSATMAIGACSISASRCRAASPRALRTLHAGTPSYMNPEQWRGDAHVPADAGSDLFAFGVTLYQWLTGKLLTAKSSRSRPDVSGAIRSRRPGCVPKCPSGSITSS